MVTRILQTPQQVGRIGNFVQVGNGQALNCTTSSAGVAFAALPVDSPATDILLFNKGSNDIFVAFSKTGVPTAAAPADGVPANGLIVAPSAYLTICKETNLYIAGVTATSTSVLYFYQGYGS